MTAQDAALLSLWQSRCDQGVPPHLRLVEQDNKSEQEWLDELRLIDFHLSQDRSAEKYYGG